VKGPALYYLAGSLADAADDEDGEAAAKRLTDEAVKYLEQAAKEAADVKIGRTRSPSWPGRDHRADRHRRRQAGPDVAGTGLDGKR